MPRITFNTIRPTHWLFTYPMPAMGVREELALLGWLATDEEIARLENIRAAARAGYFSEEIDHVAAV